MKRTFAKFSLMLAVALLAVPTFAASKPPLSGPDLEKQVRHELVMLPYYNIFDSLSFRVDGGNVTLLGQVARPTLKSDAQNVVKHIPGVTSVTNQIEVLPLSPFDNGIRLRTARAIYRNSVLSRYGMGAVPSIHIIVRNGNVTLEGVVMNEMDRNIAGIQANGVSGVFHVTNNLRVENSKSHS